MPSLLHDHRFLTRLQTAGSQGANPRIERVLVYSRLFLAVTAMLAARIQPIAPLHYNDLAQLVLLAYAIYSLAQLLWLNYTVPSRRFVAWSQLGDIIWPLLLSVYSDVPNPVFVIFFAFALTAAAFRWGFPETMLTALFSAVLCVIQAFLVSKGTRAFQHLLFTTVDWHRVVLRCGYLLLTGFLLGYLAEMEKELRAEIALTNRLLALSRIGNRFADALREISTEFGRVFGTNDIYHVAYQLNTDQVYKWELTPSVSTSHLRELLPSGADAELMRAYPYAFYMKRTARGISIDALDEEGRRIDTQPYQGLPLPIDADSILCVTLEMGREWQGRFVLRNATMGRNRERELRFALNTLRQVAPALYSIYLFRRLRARAGAIERARVARELHDTSIQSLIGIEMQMDVLRRCSNGDGTMAAELGRIQDLLRGEVLNLRELMQSLRATDFEPHQFLDFMAELVERFRRDTGLDARFVSELPEVSLPVPVCRELARVVQEGLVNVRKHSGAHSVCVRFGVLNNSWRLVIDDDGHGFSFMGRQTLRELDEFRRGPAVIKERVRAIGGDLVLESTPGHGSRLEITVPQKGYELYG